MKKKQTTEDNRGAALAHIAKYLESRFSFSQDDFLMFISSHGADKNEEGIKKKSEKTLQRYIHGETAMKSWTFDEFWELVESGVISYLENRTKDDAAIWEQEKSEQEEICRYYFLDLNAINRVDDFPEIFRDKVKRWDKGRQNCLDGLRPLFLSLDNETSYKLQHNFPALASVTAEDTKFMVRVRTLTPADKDKLRTAMLREKTLGAEAILKHLQSAEVRHWVNIRDVQYKDAYRKNNDTNTNWEVFCEQCEKMNYVQFLTMVPFLLTVFLSSDYKAASQKSGVVVPFLTKDDIDLLMLFKYCLALEAREKYIEST